MRKVSAILVILLASFSAFAFKIIDDSVTIGDRVAPDASVALQVESTSKGFAPPRMTTAQRDAIASPVDGLILFNTTTSELNLYQGGGWGSIAGSGGGLSAWTVATSYVIGDIVYDSTTFKIYRANTAHTSDAADINVDITAGRLDELSDLTILGGTQGSVTFLDANALITEDNTNFFWDDTNNRLGIGTNTPSVDLDVAGEIASTKLTVSSTTEGSTPCPSMTEAQRDAIGAPAQGECVYNSDDDEINLYDGSAWKTSGIDPLVKSSLSTGLLDGGVLSIGTPTSTFSITDGFGLVVENQNTSADPTVTSVSWSGLTNVALTDISENFTSIGIDSTGAVVQKPGARFTNEERRDNIVLGVVIHVSHSVIESVATVAEIAYEPAVQLIDLTRALGIINISGNDVSPNGANLNLDLSAGTAFNHGANYDSNKKDPNVVTVAADTAFTWTYSYQDGVGGFTSVPTQTSVVPGS